jgi:uncharacterized protein YfdQ (DUF2303 family)
MSDELNSEAIQSIIELSRSTGEPQQIGNLAYAVIPKDAQLVTLEKFLYNEHAAKPERTKANVSVLDPASFIEYFALYRTPQSRVFAFEPTISVLGVIDYHEAQSAAWCQHRVTLNLRQSEQWKAWTARNNKQMTQTEFAEFLEQNAVDIVQPSPASVIEVARELEAKTEVEFGSGVRTQDGQFRFRYSEQIKATVGGGQVEVPERFIVSIPVFIGGQDIQLEALLRFRCKDAKLVFWYTLVRPEETIRQAFFAAREQIAAALNVVIINGTPESK